MILDIDIGWTRDRDHAGLVIGFALLGYGVLFRIYDTRHWDYETDSFIN
jgi:hypothetical protein